MNTSRVIVAGAMLLALGAIPTQAETGDLKIRFEYGGSPFEPAPVNVNKDVEFCGKKGLKNEALLVHPDNRGIKNVIVYLYTGRGGSDLPKVEPSDETHTLANSNCRFDPHVVIARAGDTVKVTNPDAVGHNANLNFLINTAQNFTIPPGQAKEVELEEPEPAPIPVLCNIHPWMKAHLLVLEHPFAAKSDENGELVIKGLPAGDELVFRVWIEAADGKIGEVIADGEKLELDRRNTFEYEIKPGMNDMGTVVIPADVLSVE